MAKKIRFFTGTTGLYTKDDPARIVYNPKTGVNDFAACKNVDIDNTGRPSRRKGFTEITSGNYHSAFCDGGDCLFVTGVTLGRLLPDLTGVAVATVAHGARMRYAQVNNRIYYCNGRETGYVEGGVNNEWVMGTYYGPDTDRQFVGPPVGETIGYYNLRMYVSQGRTCFYSEPSGFNFFDLKGNYWMLDSRIRMTRPVRDGIFLGTDIGVFFYAGDEPKDVRVTKVCDYPVAERSDTNFHGTLLFTKDRRPYIDQKSGGLSAMWIGKKGLCYGGADGSFINLTQDNIDLPDDFALTGSGIVFDGRFIGIMNP